jgi:DNA-directed RNA polymerase specialized sigma24 family protein
MHDNVESLLERCSSLDRRIVRWVVRRGLPDDEIAARLARPVEVVRRRRQRLVGELRAVRAAS